MAVIVARPCFLTETAETDQVELEPCVVMVGANCWQYSFRVQQFLDCQLIQLANCALQEPLVVAAWELLSVRLLQVWDTEELAWEDSVNSMREGILADSELRMAEASPLLDLARQLSHLSDLELS